MGLGAGASCAETAEKAATERTATTARALEATVVAAIASMTLIGSQLHLSTMSFFCGLKEYLDYASGTLDYFDNCSTKTFSLLWIEDFIRQGENEVTERTCIYWCLPRNGIRDGLCCIENDSHIVAMMAAVQAEKELNLIVDHTNFVRGLREDVVVPIPSKYLGGNGNESGKEDADDVGNGRASDKEDAEGGDNGSASDKEDAEGGDGSDSADSRGRGSSKRRACTDATS
ncbi:hypothetical protein ACQ4PT_070353 [Festuca glaucescens]